MTPRTVRLDDVPPQRWRNGGGLTRELLAWPRPEAWRVRVSVADVATDGPFSPFPGVERWFAVVDGHGLALTVGADLHHLTPASAPLHFSGETPAACRLLDGPTRDLNLMLRGMRGGMFRVDAGQPWRPRAAQCGLYAAVAGRCEGGARIDLPAGCLLWFDDAPPSLHFLPAAGEVAVAGWWLAATPQEHAGWA